MKHPQDGRWKWLHRAVLAVGVVYVSIGVLLVCASTAWASGNDIGSNLGGLLKGYAGELYGGIVAAFSLMFLVNRRYSELAVFLLAAVVVAWMVFDPGEIGNAAKAIGNSIFG